MPPRVPQFLSFCLGFVIAFYEILNLLIYVCFIEGRKRLYIGLIFTVIGIVCIWHGVASV